MFNSLLNAVGVDSLILDIFIILGVVVAGALIVYFLWEAVASLINKNKTEHSDSKQETKIKSANMEDFNLEQNAPIVLVDENKLEQVDEAKATEEQAEQEKDAEEEKRQNDERRAYLEARRQELIRRMQADVNQPKEENQEEPVVEKAESVEEKEEIEEETVVDDSLEKEKRALEEEKARYAQMVAELEKAREALIEQSNKPAPVAEPAVVNVDETIPVEYSLEELKEKLATAEERLKATEKEFKQCKKEYIPLKKVWVAHEKDVKKLRRKEALVAKQKVLLYGVNNYADIDEEKAKKLAEDLDLLDGLKLSVQHCEEVMEKNAERYPLLEKMYNVLKMRNDELKNDIATYRAEIEKIEAEQNED